jgi:hypothetical protein
MSDLENILRRYKDLCDFCDRFWNRVHEKYPDAFACAPGCGTCCELSSVNYLEAYIIAGLPAKKPESGATDKCPYLDNDRCSIYASRPLICRTHGLPMKSREYSYALTLSCPFNFTRVDLDAVDPSFVLETDTVSNNLARLNAAFCMVNGSSVAKAGERIKLRDLADGTVTRESLLKRHLCANPGETAP